MTEEEDFKLLKIKTCVLKVNIHCDGCKQKVKKLLQRIEGVYQVSIDADQQKVTVSGTVDHATLIKKLIRAGKHAEVWGQKSNHSQKQVSNCIKDDKINNGQKQGIIKGLETLKKLQKFPAFSSEEGDDYFDDDDDTVVGEDDEEDELRFLSSSQLGLLRQQIEAKNAKKGIATTMAALAGPNNGDIKMNNNAGLMKNGQKKGNPNQNMAIDFTPAGEFDQKAMSGMKMNNLIEAGKMGGNSIATMMNLAGLQGNGPNILANPAAIPDGLAGFPQIQSNTGYQASSSTAAGFHLGGNLTAQYPSTMAMNMNGFNHPSNRHVMHLQQPQLMYQQSPFIPPNTGYYYSYSPAAAAPYSYTDQQPTYCYGDSSASATAHIFSDENTSSCSIM